MMRYVVKELRMCLQLLRSSRWFTSVWRNTSQQIEQTVCWILSLSLLISTECCLHTTGICRNPVCIAIVLCSSTLGPCDLYGMEWFLI